MTFLNRKIHRAVSAVLALVFMLGVFSGCVGGNKQPGEEFEFSLSLTEKQLIAGENFAINAVFEEGSQEDIVWSVSDSEILRFTSDGTTALINAVKEGTATVYADIVSKNARRSCQVTVNPDKVKLNADTIALKLGDSIILTASFVKSKELIEWSVSDPSIILTEESGTNKLEIMAIKEGEVKVTAQAANSKAECVITTYGDLEFDEELMSPHTIMLTYYDESATEYGITWHSHSEYYVPAVKIAEGNLVGSSDVTYDRTITAAADKGFETKKQNGDIYTDYAFRAVIDDLKFDTVYTYVVGDLLADVWGEQATFKTRKQDIDSFTFINITDSQENSSSKYGLDNGRHSFEALDGAFATYPDAELIVHSGDMAEYAEYEESWQKIVDYNRKFYTYYPTMFVSGNHDTTYRGAKRTFIRHFNVDYPVGQNEDNGIYYSFDYANAHFTMLNTNVLTGNELTAQQLSWLKADLSATDKTWKIIVMHNPMFSPAKWGSQITGSATNAIAIGLQRQLLSVFEEYGVDLVIQGHDHVAMDTYPINGQGDILNQTQSETAGGVNYWINPQGTVFHMSATSGSSTNQSVGEADMSYYRFYSRSYVSSYAAFVVEEDQITVKTHYYNNGANTLYAGSAYGIKKSK